MTTSKWGSSRGSWAGEYEQASQIKRDGQYNGEVITLTKTSDGMVIPDFTKRVNAGMDLLDKINPGWQDELNLGALDLEDDQQCVLGQSFPLYARALGLVETGDYKEFADAIFNLGDAKDRNLFAASIGCALNEADVALINGEAVAWVAEKHGVSPEVVVKTYDYTCEASTRCKYAMKRYWEELTATWITQIIKAKVEGRWGPRTVDTLDASIKALKEKEAVATS